MGQRKNSFRILDEKMSLAKKRVSAFFLLNHVDDDTKHHKNSGGSYIMMAWVFDNALIGRHRHHLFVQVDRTRTV